MENTFAPRVVRPPCASRIAWKSSTMVPRKARTGGLNSTAPAPVPVGCEDEPVTEGSFTADSAKVKAPAAASRSLESGSLRTCLTTALAPWTTNGAEATNQAAACRGGRKPSAMCMTNTSLLRNLAFRDGAWDEFLTHLVWLTVARPSRNSTGFLVTNPRFGPHPTGTKRGVHTLPEAVTRVREDPMITRVFMST